MKTKQAKSNVGLFFLDSGAHSLYNQHVWKKKRSLAKVTAEEYAWYETQPFWDYVDQYAAFVKKYKDVIDFYANVDVIYNPEKTWEVQQYIEKNHGIRPVPVIHYGADIKWAKKYVDGGYELLGIGGLGQGATKTMYLAWADRIFDFLCPPPKRLPIIKAHGFAMTAYDLMLRYPWWSVDSATWTKVGAFGSIMVPHQRGGKFVFNTEPYIVTTSVDSNGREYNKHLLNMRAADRKVVEEWLTEINVPLGKNDDEGNVVEHGVINRHSERKIANLLFFERFRKSLPEWPWPYNPQAGLEKTGQPRYTQETFGV